MNTTMWFDVVDLFGVFVGGITGALVARRFSYDITGIWALALVSGLGGGMIRDVLLQAGPPLALVEPRYLPTVLVATFVGAFFGGRIDSLKGTILVADAVAISGFAVAGTLRTFDTGFGPWPAVLLGVITAVGGGLIRDVMTGVQPAIFQRSELYAFAALGTSLSLVLLRALDLPRGMIILISIAVGIALRLGSVRFGWTTWAPR
ncbi:MAG TPA: TRIC cation channel family protein [Thermomicrobiales bacterium]|nr:TRIC cation channel family protein [Thermomicrobiales bacterium]